MPHWSATASWPCPASGPRMAWWNGWGAENLSKGVQLKLVDDMLDVDLFIIVEYGISIAEVCKTIVETVRYKLESMTGVKVRRVNISVEGVRV